MKRNYTSQELDYKFSHSKKEWEEYILTREQRRAAAKKKIAAAILAAEMIRDGRQ